VVADSSNLGTKIVSLYGITSKKQKACPGIALCIKGFSSSL
jgi:hypothetical protein